MIKINERLRVIADRVENSKAMADIGSDHGFLPVYLLQSGKCEKAIATDISPASLSKAEMSGRLYLDDVTGFETRVGDGLKVLESSEVDTIVIAGMGGKLIRDIMNEDISHTCSFRRYVLQPRIGQGHLRKWLCDNGFMIINEDLVFEGKHIPEIITAISPGNATIVSELNLKYKDMITGDGDSIQFRIPPWINKAQGPVAEFLQKNLDNEKNVLQNVMMSNQRNKKLEEKLCDNIFYLKRLLKEAGNGTQYK